jgi:DNA polymerase-3 subunit delta'
LLKTLEEPPATSYIVLISSHPDSLLQTIRSRCQTIRFAPVPESLIAKHLAEIGQLKGQDAELAARVSKGSIGSALSLDLAKFREIRTNMLGVLQDAMLHHDIASVLRSSEQMNDAKNKDDFETAIGILESLAHDAWLIRNNTGRDSIVNLDLADELSKIAAGCEPSKLAGFMSAIEELRQSLQVNINKKIATDALFARFAAA